MMLPELWGQKFFAYDLLLSRRSLTNQTRVVTTRVKQVFLLSGPSRICCTCELQAENNTFLEQFPHNHVHFWLLSAQKVSVKYLKNCSFVPKAILQPHTSRQQFKLISWAPSSCLLQLPTEGFGFPDVCAVLQRLAPTYRSWVLLGPHSAPEPIPTTPLKHFYKGHQCPPDLQEYWIASWLYLVQPPNSLGRLKHAVLKPCLSRFPYLHHLVFLGHSVSPSSVTAPSLLNL